MIYKSKSVLDTEKLGIKIASVLKAGDIIAYEGGLGMGKTALTRGIAKALGDDSQVSSPTFSIVNEYLCCSPKVYHFDMYRISSLDDLYSIGFFDYIDDSSIIIIEWSENIKEVLPSNTIYIKFENTGENTRNIIIENININL